MPEAWAFKTLEELANIVSGGTPSRVVAEFWGGEIPWVTPTDISRTKGNYLFEAAERISTSGLTSSSATLLPKGSILLTSRASIGDSKIAAQEVTTNQGFKSLVPKPGTNGVFLFYQIGLHKNELFRFAAGSTFLEINRKDVARIKLPVPNDPNHQKKIAAILETVDLAIEQTEALIAKYEQVKAGMMQDLFTRGLTPEGKLRPTRQQAPDQYQKTPIGWIPKEWEVKELVKLAHFQRGHDIVEAAFESGEFPVISSGGIIGHHSCFTSKGPGVVIGRKGTIGKVHFSEGDYWAHDTSLYSTDFFDNEPKFIFHLCQWLDLARFGTKSGSPSLNRNDIHPLLVGRPPCDEQKEITLRIEGMVRNCSALGFESQKLRQQKSGLMHDLLTSKVAVKV